MNLTTAVLLAVAAARLAHLLVADDITRGFREWVWRRWPRPDWLLDIGDRPGRRWPGAQPHPAWEYAIGSGWFCAGDSRGSLFGRLLLCSTWCMTVWTSAAIVTAHTIATVDELTAARVLRALINWWSVAGLAVPVAGMFDAMHSTNSPFRQLVRRLGDAALVWAARTAR